MSDADVKGGGVSVRASRDEDVPAMLAIYARHVSHGLDDGADEIEMPQIEDIKRRRKNMHKRGLPHLVAEADGAVIGYAYVVPFRKRPAYRYVVKHSIYVHPDHLHRGVGRMLLPALIDACAAEGYRQIIGYIDGSNAASIKLHEAAGFRQVGFLPAIGYKFGKWTDCVMMQRSLGPGSGTSPERR